MIPTARYFLIFGALVAVTVAFRTARVPENIANAFVANVSSSPIREDEHYALDANDERIATRFVIDSRTGVIRTRIALDFDSPRGNVYDIFIVIVRSGRVQRAAVPIRVFIVDANDNRPVFPRFEPFRGSIDENASSGTRVMSFYTFDVDTVGSVSFGCLSPHSGVFDVGSMTSAIGRFTIGEIILVGVLDRERQSVYRFNIEACDGVHTSRIDVVIDIGDVNDNSPVFSHDRYSAFVSEMIAPGTSIGQVSALDLDEGLNSEIEYRLSVATNFSVDPYTGVVTVDDRLVGFGGTTIGLRVWAYDRGLIPRNASAYFDVHVVETNKQAPAISFSLVNQGFVREDVSVGVVVAHVSVTDSGVVDVKVLWQGKEQGPFDLERTDGGSFALRTVRMLDRETVSEYELVIEATDRGIPSLSAGVVVVIRVLDLNDNKPRFLRSPRNVYIDEDLLIGTLVAKMDATDADEGTNAQLRYSISAGNFFNSFTIDRDTGLITTAKSLDAGQEANYLLTVVATDRGATALSSSTQVILHVRDENNNSPRFLQKVGYTADVRENQPPGTSVLRLTAIDGDLGMNGRISFDLIFDNLKQLGPFTVNVTSGEIFTTTSLDYEEVKFYVFTARATDSGLPYSRFGEILVRVNVINENDNAPRFSRPEYSPLIPIRATIDSTVTQVKAIDEDGNKVSYSLVSGDTSYFNIDPNGVITIKRSLLSNSYSIGINATDGSHVVSTQVKINAYDSSVRAPIFNPSTHTFVVREDATRGYTVGQVSASSQDGFPVVYDIADGNTNKTFSLNQAGFIELNGSIDYETVKVYVLTVTATDTSKSIQRTGVARVLINITNVNDNSPVISSSTPTHVSIPQNVSAGVEILTVTAFDADNDPLEFTLKDPTNTFALTDRRHGIVRLTRDFLDVEPTPSFSGLSVNVSDARHSTTLLFSVEITDVNNHAPVFAILPAANVSENAPIGHLVTVATAHDADSGYNALVRYSVEGASSFTIDPVTGRVTVNSGLDFEKQSRYNVTIIAGDLGHPQNFASTQLIIDVMNVNDLSPVFIRLNSFLNVSEDVQIGTAILTLSAMDPDGCSLVTYQLGSDVNGIFVVEEISGTVRVGKALDREKTPQLQFVVEAVDCGPHPMTSRASIHVQLLDVNDEPPTFAVRQYGLDVKANFPVGAKAMTVYAEDLDEGPNGTVTYSLISGNASTWRVDALTGSITLLGSLCAGTSYVLQIVASDVVAPFQSAEVNVTIRVTRDNRNYHRPTFSKSLLFSYVQESVNPAFIESLPATDEDQGRDGQLTYYLSDGTGLGLFDLNSTTGDLSARASLDRETQSWYSLSVTAQDDGLVPYSSQMDVVIIVVDMNDNRPILSEVYTEGFVPRCATGSDFVAAVTAFDPDNGTSGEIQYETDHPDFDIDSSFGIISTKPGIIYDASYYDLIVTVKDEGIPSLESTAFVRIQTVDCPADLPPRFLGLPYQTKVLENRPYHYVYQVLAVDQNEVGAVYYALRSDSDSERFVINSTTGVISCQSLDYESQHIYEIGVIASVGSRTAVTNLTVEVIDVYRERPVFSNQSYSVTIPENFKDNLAIIGISARGYLPLSYSLVLLEPAAARLFRIDLSTGIVTKVGNLDFETRSQYVLYVQAKYNGSHLFSITSVTVMLSDVDDNLPVFDRSPYSVMLKSPLQLNESVVTVYAADADSGTNAAVEYKMSSDYFSINQLTGEVTLVKIFAGNFVGVQVTAENPYNRSQNVTGLIQVSLLSSGMSPPSFGFPKVVVVSINETMPLLTPIPGSRKVKSGSRLVYSIVGGNTDSIFSVNLAGEVLVAKLLKVRQFHLVVRASASTLTDDITYIINVLPVRNRRPIFALQSPMQIDVDEDSPPGTFVALVKAYNDEDGDITYSVQGDAARLRIDSVSGLVTVGQKTVDYETSAFYSLAIVATASGTPPISSALVVNVTVLDLDDPAPKFAVSPLAVTLNENIGVGSYVATVAATDPLGSLIRYSSASHLFRVDPLTGSVSVSGQLDRDGRSSDNVVITASNGLVTADTDLLVTLKDINDNSPRFNQSRYIVNVSESTLPGQLLLTVDAFDPDEGKNGTVQYFLKATMNPNSLSLFDVFLNGSVILKSSLNREIRQYYHLVIEAADSGSPPRKNYTQVDINILDDNDHAPVFSSPNYQVSISEDEREKADVITVRATDKDIGSNGQITYSIQTGNVNGAFNIDSSLGTIVLARSLDYESLNIYVLDVLATDHGSPSLTGSCTVQVNVLDALDTRPEFTQRIYQVNMRETDVIGTFVVSARVSSVYRVTYTSASANVSVDADRGIVLTTTAIDYEKDSSLSFEVQATDGYHQTGTAQVIVSLIDVNDNMPTFEREFYVVRVPDDAAIGAELLSVVAHDQDSGSNGEVRYYFADDGAVQILSVDSVSGQITLGTSLKNLRGRVVRFGVQAKDLGNPSLTANHPVFVEIHVVEPHYPKFTNGSYSAQIVAPADVSVIQVHAVNEDVNGTLHYSIRSGNERGNFGINFTSGEITVVKPTGMSEFYNLVIEVNDRFHSDFTNVFINVTSLFEFEQQAINVSVSEDTRPGTILLRPRLLTTHEDLVFRIKPLFTEFDVTKEGNLIVGFSLDREFKPSYDLIIEAVYLAEPIEIAEIAVRVNVIDVNDNSPSFLGPQPFRGYFEENLSSHSTVYTMFANDPDEEEILTFRLIGSSTATTFPFQITSDGDIYLTRQADSNLLPSYNVTVEVTDSGGRSAVAVVTLIKASENAHQLGPVFEHAAYFFNVSESEAVGTPIGVVRGYSGLLSYSVVAGNKGGAFKVDGRGLLSVANRLNYEAIQLYVLTIRLSGIGFSQVNVTIHVLDANEYAPRLLAGNYLSFSVRENETLGSSLYLVAVVDEDGINRGQKFYVEDKYNGTFAIGLLSGEITLQKQLDYESQKKYAFDVIVRDAGEPILYSVIRCTVLVINVNDVVPRFVGTYEFFLLSPVKTGTVIGQLLAIDEDDLSPLKYTIESGNEKQLFSLNSDDGLLTLNHGAIQLGYYAIHVRVFDGSFSAYETVSVVINSVDVHAPSFASATCSANVTEASSPGTLVTRLTATDPDFGIKGAVIYTIQRERSKFRISNTTGDVFTDVPSAELTIRPRPLFSIITARDGDGNAAFCRFEVTVIDINNHAPQFLTSSYEVTVRDTINAREEILRVIADDEDEGSNAEIRYDILPNTTIFSIDDKGNIYAKPSLLNVTKAKQHVFQVQATDNGQPSLSSTTTVVVNVTDLPNDAPLFDHFDYYANIEENQPSGTYVARVNASGAVRYSIHEGSTPKHNNPRKFRILSSGVITTSDVLDYESMSEYVLLVQASNAVGNAYGVLHVSVVDANDNRPEFQPSEYRLRVSENRAIGAEVGDVIATDLDSGLNKNITYGLKGVLDAHLFDVNQETGHITTKAVFDRENLTSAYFHVVARAEDRGIPSLGAETLVRIEVADVNDNRPAFAQSEYTISVREDVPLGYTLPLTLQVNDLDSSSLFSFSITAGNVKNAFGVLSGKLTVRRSLDFEILQAYRLEISVNDGLFQSTTLVTVNIIDVDDVAPAFPNASYVISASEDVTTGSYVFQLSATDADSTPYQIKYSMFVTRGSDSFAINASTGTVRTTGVLDREIDRLCEYSVVATDSAGNQGYALLTVHLNDVNDRKPAFNEGPYVAYVKENAALGTLVGRFTADDDDLGKNSALTYSLIDSADGQFYINSANGRIFTNGYLDRETVSEYRITVGASDGGAVSLSGEANVTIVVEDVNDNAPYFKSAYMGSRVYEDASPGWDVLVLSAQDRDVGTNALVDYVIESGNENRVFAVEDNIIKIARMPKEFPDTRQYSLTVNVLDRGVPRLQGSGNVIVGILDANDHAPVFGASTYDVAVPEDVQLFTDILTVNATDADLGTNGKVRFRLVDSYDCFHLTAEGRLQAIYSLDYETRKLYNLTVEAIDEGHRIQFTSTAALIVKVTDVNDNAPLFATPAYVATVIENSPSIGSVIEVKASDPDTGDGGRITYALKYGSDMFSLNSSTGILSAVSDFDREVRSYYNLTVLATDGGYPSLTGSAVIYVAIGDVNDNPSEGGGKRIDIVAQQGKLRIGKIGDINPGDPDTGDSFLCKDVRSSQPDAITVDDNCSVILTSADLVSEAIVRVKATDEVHPYVDCNVTIGVHYLTENEMNNFVVIEINETAEYLLDVGYVKLKHYFAIALDVSESQIQVISINKSKRNTSQVALAVNGWSEDLIVATLSRSMQKFPFGIASVPVDMCVDEPCQNLGKCINVKSVAQDDAVSLSTRSSALIRPRVETSSTCACQPGTTGLYCQTDIDECFSSPCQNGGTCVDQLHGFACLCPEYATGSICENAPDACTQKPCQNGGICRSRESEYECLCSNAYTGSNCEISIFDPREDACASASCQNGATCTAGRSGFTCTCSLGFTGKTCAKATSETRSCTSNPCKHGGTCRNGATGYVCSCPSEYLNVEGSDCSWENNPCDLLPCLNGGTCYEGHFGRYGCDCADGFSGIDCQVPPPVCESNPCQNGGRCLQDVSGEYDCACTEMFYGRNCEHSISPPDYCSLMPCRHGGNCTSGRNTYTCSCASGYYGNQCQHVGTIDACSSNPCLYGGQCTVNGSDFTCACSPGFYGERCAYEYDHCYSTPCSNGGTCVADVNSFVCACPLGVGGRLCEILCPVGYTGIDCDENVDVCTSMHCLNNGTCYAENGLAVCACSDNFDGPLCQRSKTCDCKHGGNCQSEECVCPSEYDGPRCELTSVTFGGRGAYRTFPPITMNVRGGTVLLEISTLSSDGFIMYNSQWVRSRANDVIAIQLINGRISLIIDMGDGSETFGVEGVRVDDGKWHSIAVTRVGKNVHLSVDSCAADDETCQREGTTLGLKEDLNVGLPLYFGSHPDSSVKTNGFEGCIRNVYIDGEIVDLADYVLENGTTEGCTAMTRCTAESCAEGATCVESYDGFECVCPLGKSGRHCEQGEE